MDRYNEVTFDPWLEDSVKQDWLQQLNERWNRESQGHALFISATEKQNIDALRDHLLNMVREQYTIRYPYRDQFYK
jgi:GTP-binding protein HflX